MGVEDKNVIVGPSASLNLMFDYISQCYVKGAIDGMTPWSKLDEVKFYARFRDMTGTSQFVSISALK